jgi:hypothetical protein
MGGLHVNEPALPGRGVALRILLLAAAIAVAPVPATAGPAAQPPADGGLHAKAKALVARQVLAMPAPAATRRASTADQTDLGSRSFFKTPAGILTIVTIAAGVGYALYSTSHDRIRSPGRQEAP